MCVQWPIRGDQKMAIYETALDACATTFLTFLSDMQDVTVGNLKQELFCIHTMRLRKELAPHLEPFTKKADASITNESAPRFEASLADVKRFQPRVHTQPADKPTGKDSATAVDDVAASKLQDQKQVSSVRAATDSASETATVVSGSALQDETKGTTASSCSSSAAAQAQRQSRSGGSTHTPAAEQGLQPGASITGDAGGSKKLRGKQRQSRRAAKGKPRRPVDTSVMD